jgi:hypothetical protein
MPKPTLVLDFDGVIHSYSSGWKGADVIPDLIVPGFFEWAEQAAKHFKLVIFSSRSGQPNGITAMQFYLYEQRKLWRAAGGMPETNEPLSFEFAEEKPPAFVTIDDRALCFTGNFADFDPVSLLAFKPWNKK